MLAVFGGQLLVVRERKPGELKVATNDIFAPKCTHALRMDGCTWTVDSAIVVTLIDTLMTTK